MKQSEYDRVCYRTQQRDEAVKLRNLKTGKVGYTFGCTYSGNTVQVKLSNGEYDSWSRDDCIETTN